MPKYNHAHDFAFEVSSAHPDGEDITPGMLRKALLARANNLSDHELMQACGHYDTYEMREES
jgi:hypothetical protein